LEGEKTATKKGFQKYDFHDSTTRTPIRLVLLTSVAKFDKRADNLANIATNS
jgi:hypothetical protein